MDENASEPSEPAPPSWSPPEHGLGPAEDLEAPAELPGELLGDIKDHLAEHGLELQPERDVAWQGHKPPGALIEAWLASPSGAAGFHCARCERRFIVGEPEHGPLRTNRLLRKNPALAAQLRGADPEEVDSLVEAWERGELAPAINERRLRKVAEGTRQRRRESDLRRIAGCQRWMLKRRAEIGQVDAVIAELYALLRDDLAARWEITGGDFLPREGTVRKYWTGGRNPISQAKRNASEAAYLRRPEAERKAIEKARRLGEPPPPVK
jgi:hypothetical protein